MKLRTRLVVGFLSVTILPLMLFVAVIIFFSQMQVKTIKQNYGVTGSNSYEILVNSMTTLGNAAEPVYEAMKQDVWKNPAILTDITYLEKVNNKLNRMNSYLVIRDGNELTFVGSDMGYTIYKMLPEYGNEESSSEGGTYIGGDIQVLARQIDYISDTEAEASVFVITDVGRVIPEIGRLFQNLCIAATLVLILTAGGIIIWIYRGVAIPLARMKIATQNIKDGNLDYELEVVSDDELGQLCRDFEEMRVRLKDNATEKIANDKRSKELISNISHDLKTPITAIKGYVEGIMDGVADTPEKMERYIKTIYNKANEMDMLINELTLYSKIDSDNVPYNFELISVTDYFEDCAADLRMELEARKVVFTYENEVNRNTKIVVDAEQMKRVINNIVSNSLKYMEKQEKRIDLRVKDAGDFVQIEIEDNGIGIAVKELAYIFERFYRTDTSRNSSTGGSGIGLSIVKKIAEDHGGKIWATSEEGKGTTMHLVLRKNQEGFANE